MHLARLVKLINLDEETAQSLMDENSGNTAKKLIGLLAETKSHNHFKMIFEHIRASLTIRSEILENYMKELKDAFFKNCFLKLNSRDITLEEAQRIGSIASNFCQTREDDNGKMGKLCTTANKIIETLQSQR